MDGMKREAQSGKKSVSGRRKGGRGGERKKRLRSESRERLKYFSSGLANWELDSRPAQSAADAVGRV